MSGYLEGIMPALSRAASSSQPSQAYLDSSNIATILGVTGAFGLAAVVTVILRLYVRISILKFVGPDDYFVVAAALMTIATFIGFCGESNYGLGRHYQATPPEDIPKLFHWQFYHSLFVMFGVVFVKISVGFFLMRIVPQRWWRIFLWSCIVFLGCFSLACAGTLIFSCVPVEASWNFALQAKPTTKCFSNSTFANIGLFNSIINILTDVLFAMMPVPIIYKLQVNRRTKITLLFVLSLGFIACAAGIVKAHAQLMVAGNSDRLWEDTFMVWNMLELCLGIMACSFPALKPLAANVLKSTRSRLGASSRSRSRPPGVYPGLSETSGYRRQYDPRNFDEIMHEVALGDYKNATSATLESGASDESPKLPSKAAKGKTPYNVRVTSSVSAERDEWENAEVSRSDSEERLHRPMAIFRRTEVSHHSEVLQK